MRGAPFDVKTTLLASNAMPLQDPLMLASLMLLLGQLAENIKSAARPVRPDLKRSGNRSKLAMHVVIRVSEELTDSLGRYFINLLAP